MKQCDQPRQVQELILTGVYGVRETAGYLGVDVSCIYEAFSHGDIKAFKVGRAWKTTGAVIKQWLDRQLESLEEANA